MGDERLIITEAGFLTEFLNQHSQRTDRPFCFILGAGVSRSSSIPTGGEMAQVWLRELYEAENFEGLSLEEWATPQQLGIPGFSANDLARFYPQLYKRALKADAKNPTTLAFYADFLDRFRKAPDEAEEYYLRALEASPDDHYTLTSYAQFLRTVRKDSEKAQELERRAASIKET